MTLKKIPMRMCIACREMKEKRGLLRIVKNADGKIFWDEKGKASGRGAYICDNPACINKCVKKKLLNKVFSSEIPDDVYVYISGEYAAMCAAKQNNGE
ncbi:MAG: YlxR family protein [Clostridiales bacterium]|jgi:predicted RNA-binding protein YlxR (DUF448 family)|nr:YlxR family protein [Clostridiales bacterium]